MIVLFYLLLASQNSSNPSSRKDEDGEEDVLFSQNSRLIFDLIRTMNTCFPDYDFSSMTQEDFQMIDDVYDAIEGVSLHLGDLSSVLGHSFWEEVWESLQGLVGGWENCEVYQYLPEFEEGNPFTDGPLWSANLFFVNKRMKRILYFTCIMKRDRSFYSNHHNTSSSSHSSRSHTNQYYNQSSNNYYSSPSPTSFQFAVPPPLSEQDSFFEEEEMGLIKDPTPLHHHSGTSSPIWKEDYDDYYDYVQNQPNTTPISNQPSSSSRAPTSSGGGILKSPSSTSIATDDSGKAMSHEGSNTEDEGDDYYHYYEDEGDTQEREQNWGYWGVG